MLGSVTLRRARLHHAYPETPPECRNLVYPCLGLDDVPHFVVKVEYQYRSVDPNIYPHRFKLLVDDDAPRLSVDDRVLLHDCEVGTFEMLESPESFIVDGWIIGIHFELKDFVEYTILGMFDGVLQVVFLDVPQSHIDRRCSPPHTVFLNRQCYWTYMTPYETESRARVIQKVGGDLRDWSPTYVQVQSHLMTLRMTNVRHFPLIDMVYFPPVSDLSGFASFRSDIGRLSEGRLYVSSIRSPDRR